MVAAQLIFYEIIIHGLERHTLYHKKDPIAIAWIYLETYITFMYKPSMLLTKK